jgi:TolA-binding protein
MKRSERHHLKENELAQTIARASEVLTARRREISGAIVAVVVLAAAVAGYLVWRGRLESRAGAALADALAVSDAPIAPPAAPAQPGTPAPTPPPGSYPTEKARLEAALPKFLDVANGYASTDAGLAARYHAANSLAALGRVQDAQARYQEVIDRDGAGIYGQMARLGLADLQVASGQYDHAITIYKALTADRDTRLPVDGVLMQLGRAYARAGKSADARQTFTRIVDEFPESLYVTAAKQELAKL